MFQYSINPPLHHSNPSTPVRPPPPLLPEKALDAKIMGRMGRFAIKLSAIILAAWLNSSASAQTFAAPPSSPDTATQLQALSKKIDEQNAKIDTLSQQILKLEQQIANMRPGVMIGESTPAPSSASSSPAENSHQSGNTHTVARGETLTSIAKMHNVTVSELQKFNHIENDRKLQIGQTIMIPGSPTPAPSSSPPG